MHENVMLILLQDLEPVTYFDCDLSVDKNNTTNALKIDIGATKCVPIHEANSISHMISANPIWVKVKFFVNFCWIFIA